MNGPWRWRANNGISVVKTVLEPCPKTTTLALDDAQVRGFTRYRNGEEEARLGLTLEL